MYVQVKIYREFYHSVIYTANERRHVRIYYYFNTKLNPQEIPPSIKVIFVIAAGIAL
jgi:hypothetical protein